MVAVSGSNDGGGACYVEDYGGGDDGGSGGDNNGNCGGCGDDNSDDNSDGSCNGGCNDGDSGGGDNGCSGDDDNDSDKGGGGESDNGDRVGGMGGEGKRRERKPLSYLAAFNPNSFLRIINTLDQQNRINKSYHVGAPNNRLQQDSIVILPYPILSWPPNKP